MGILLVTTYQSCSLKLLNGDIQKIINIIEQQKKQLAEKICDELMDFLREYEDN